MFSNIPKVRVSGAIEFVVSDSSFERIKTEKKRSFSFTVQTNNHHKMIFDDSDSPIKYRVIKFRSKDSGIVGAIINRISVMPNRTGKFKRVEYKFNEIIPSSAFNLRKI